MQFTLVRCFSTYFCSLCGFIILECCSCDHHAKIVSFQLFNSTRHFLQINEVQLVQKLARAHWTILQAILRRWHCLSRRAGGQAGFASLKILSHLNTDTSLSIYFWPSGRFLHCTWKFHLPAVACSGINSRHNLLLTCYVSYLFFWVEFCVASIWHSVIDENVHCTSGMHRSQLTMAPFPAPAMCGAMVSLYGKCIRSVISRILIWQELR